MPILDRSWVVVPAYNEARRIGPVLDQLLARGTQVVVDDGSSDGTRDEVLRRPVWLVRHADNLGQDAAIQTGIRFALDRGAEYLATFDADGQHDPADLQRMLSMEHASEMIDQISKSGLTFIEIPVTVRYMPDSLGKGQTLSASGGAMHGTAPPRVASARRARSGCRRGAGGVRG